jgi:hypothetical protein
LSVFGSEPRDSGAYADAMQGLLNVNPNGTVSYGGCFAAGTMVFAEQGLVPIEDIRAGMWVLSQSDLGGDRAMRQVKTKFVRGDQELMAIQVRSLRRGESGQGGDVQEQQLTTLFATPNHPFWVETPMLKDQDGLEHWLAAECLAPGMMVQMADGGLGEVRLAAFIRRTQHEGILFAGDNRAGTAQLISLVDGRLAVAYAQALSKAGPLELGERYKDTVYNFEVKEFHTYYVGEAGVWVHNIRDYSTGDAISLKQRAADIADECFDGSTMIYIRLSEETYPKYKNVVPVPGGIPDPNIIGKQVLRAIEHLAPGVEVLSRCEVTGEVAYKKVTRKFEHLVQETFSVGYRNPEDGERDPRKKHHGLGKVCRTSSQPRWCEA